MTLLETMELASYVVTVVGLPLGITVYVLEQRRERRNEDEEIYQELSDEYMDFLRLALQHADLKLFREHAVGEPFSEEQLERKNILFGILVSLFERAFLLVYEEKMSRQARRLWQSWEDYMREWCRRDDFRAALGELLKGEDQDFQRVITRIAEDQGRGVPAAR